ncbi:hypothetical protein [Kitasatospora sp. A2-31]|nr:hypothetical protein [Kitasatospora sp. A2-31]MCG6495807.1 hypothetical protein [Kitasatospora sp. A2-31]
MVAGAGSDLIGAPLRGAVLPVRPPPMTYDELLGLTGGTPATVAAE